MVADLASGKRSVAQVVAQGKVLARSVSDGHNSVE